MKKNGFLLQTYRGLALIVLACFILLVSDLKSRRSGSAPNTAGPDVPASERPVPGRNYSLEVAYFAPEESFDVLLKGFIAGLKDLGYIQDVNLKILLSHANAEISMIPAMLQNVENHDVDVVVLATTPVIQAALKTIRKKPMAFMYCYSPVDAGVGNSYADHLPNITGVGSFPPVEQTVELIRSLVPGIKGIGTLFNSSEVNSSKAVNVAGEYLKKMNIRLEKIPVANTNEVYQAAGVLCSRDIQAVWITGDNTAEQAFDGIIKAAAKARLPVIVNDNEFVSRGAVAGVGIGWYAVGYRTAAYAARLMNGEDPGSIPLENYVETSITLNPAAAASIGFSIPQAVMQEAAKAAEHNAASNEGPLPSGLQRLCLLEFNDSPMTEQTQAGIIDGLKSAGLVRGKNLKLDIFNAQGDIATLSTMTQKVSGDDYDLIFVTSTPTLQAAIRYIGTRFPVVFATVADPVLAGAGRSFTEHLPNITGTTFVGAYDKMPGLLRKIYPKIRSVGTLFNPGEINSVRNKDLFRNCLMKDNIKLVSVPVTSSSEVMDAVLSMVNRKPDVVCQISDNLTSSSFASIITACRMNKMPLFGFVSDQVKSGAIGAIARDYFQAGKDAANQAVRILKGKNPAEMPFESVSHTAIYLNPGAARFFGVRLPDSLLKEPGVIIVK